MGILPSPPASTSSKTKKYFKITCRLPSKAALRFYSATGSTEYLRIWISTQTGRQAEHANEGCSF
jgi:hypothetical protein